MRTEAHLTTHSTRRRTTGPSTCAGTRTPNTDRVEACGVPTSTGHAKIAGSSDLWTPEARTNLRNRHKSIEWFADLGKKVDSQWSYFLTMTFRADRSLPRHHAITAGPRLVRWCSRWETLGRADSADQCRSFRLLLWSAEEHLSGNVHIHALSVNTPSPLQRHCDACLNVLRLSPDWRILKESWWKHWGKAVVRPYDQSLKFGAERYATKYVLSEFCLDWGIETW